MPGRCMESQKLISEITFQRYIDVILSFVSKKKYQSLFHA